MAIKRALFLDRDGVINQHAESGFVANVADWRWLPNLPSIAQAILAARNSGALVFVVTNQSGVGLGLYSEDAMHAVHDLMRAELSAQNADIDDLRYSLFHPDAHDPKHLALPEWRKPAPGMILDLAEKYSVDLAASLMVGDKDTDRDAATRAGCQFVERGDGELLTDIQNWILASS